MNRLYAVPLLASALLLGACQTSSLTEEERQEVTRTDASFSGEPKTIDAEKSVISFVGKSNLIDHEGKFNAYTADIELDPEDPADLEKASFSATLDMTSIEVDAAGLQGHLQKADFFDTEQYPTATFESSSIVHKGDNVYDIRGFLTVKGVSKTVVVEAEITDEYLTAQYDFPRREFGVGNDNYGEKLLDEMVPVDIKLVFAN